MPPVLGPAAYMVDHKPLLDPTADDYAGGATAAFEILDRRRPDLGEATAHLENTTRPAAVRRSG